MVKVGSRGALTEDPVFLVIDVYGHCLLALFTSSTERSPEAEGPAAPCFPSVLTFYDLPGSLGYRDWISLQTRGEKVSEKGHCHCSPPSSETSAGRVLRLVLVSVSNRVGHLQAPGLRKLLTLSTRIICLALLVGEEEGAIARLGLRSDLHLSQDP